MTAGISRRDHTEAIGEGMIILGASTAPTTLGSLVQRFFDSTGAGYINILINNISNGELLLYTSALGFPVIYFILKDYRTPKQPGAHIPFPGRRLLSVTIGAIVAVSILIFGALKAAETIATFQGIDSAEIYFDRSLLFEISVVFFCAMIVLAYLAYVYKHSVEGGVLDTIRSESGDFEIDYFGRR